MTINWKVRLRNKTFWMTFLPSLVGIVYMVLALFDIVPSISETKMTEVVLTITGILGTLGVLVDPTTKGIGDSSAALEYETPKGDESNE